MKTRVLPFLFVVFLSCLPSTENQKAPFKQNGIYQPAEELGDLFHNIQMEQVFEDGKTFVDYTPKYDIGSIINSYNEKVDLKSFVKENFRRFPDLDLGEVNTEGKTLEEHLPAHWGYLTRNPDTTSNSGTLLPLPKSYVVPGGRFREIYYWDSYFTMLGLAESGRVDLIKDMIDNFAYLIDTYGHIPNGNRSYYLSRSQPPYFSSMVMLLAELEGLSSVVKYLPQLKKEYNFWMKGQSGLSDGNQTIRRTVKMSNGSILNRYWDDVAEPRPESYREDFELAEHADEPDSITYQHLKAGAESGWDYSSRWFEDYQNMKTIKTTQIVPVDLNSLLYHLETSIARLSEADNATTEAETFNELAELRKNNINQILWNDEIGYYTDYNLYGNAQSEYLTAAIASPLYFNIADQAKADKVAIMIKEKLLLDGGLVTTLNDTGQQWDYPNGWAPLQWIAIKGLLNYGHRGLAKEIASRWIKLNRKVFAETGKMMEKYNVADINLEAGGGEYALQDGFGWTNGVALKILAEFPEL